MANIKADSSSNGSGVSHTNGSNGSSSSSSGLNGSEVRIEHTKEEPWQWDESGDALKVVPPQSVLGHFSNVWLERQLHMSEFHTAPNCAGIWRTLGPAWGWHAASLARPQHRGPTLLHWAGSGHDLYWCSPWPQQQAATDYQPGTGMTTSFCKRTLASDMSAELTDAGLHHRVPLPQCLHQWRCLARTSSSSSGHSWTCRPSSTATSGMQFLAVQSFASPHAVLLELLERMDTLLITCCCCCTCRLIGSIAIIGTLAAPLRQLVTHLHHIIRPS